MTEIKEGESTAFFEINPLNRYTVRNGSYEEFDKVNGELQQFVDNRMRVFDANGYMNETLRKKAEVWSSDSY